MSDDRDSERGVPGGEPDRSPIKRSGGLPKGNRSSRENILKARAASRTAVRKQLPRGRPDPVNVNRGEKPEQISSGTVRSRSNEGRRNKLREDYAGSADGDDNADSKKELVGSLSDDLDVELDDDIFDDDELEALKRKRSERKKKLGISAGLSVEETEAVDDSLDDEDEELLKQGKIKIQKPDGSFSIVSLYDEDDAEEDSGPASSGTLSGSIVSDDGGSSDDDVEPWEDPDGEYDDDPFTRIPDSEMEPWGEYDDSELDLDALIMEDPDDEIKPGQSVFRGFDINAVLAKAFDDDASDVYIIPHQGVFFNKLSVNYFVPEFKIPDGRTTREVQIYLTTEVLGEEFIREQQVDSSYVIRLENDTLPEYKDLVSRYEGRRLRVSISRTGGDVYIVFRTITDKIGTPEDYGVPKEVIDWFYKNNGMVLVNGSTGTGKSTTLASIMRQIQLREQKVALTAEKPVEYQYPSDGKGIIIQVEVGSDNQSFSHALDMFMRQSPDIILIGEVRNKEEISELIRASLTGHLAVSTMHTNTVAGTIMRIKEEHKEVLPALSDSIRGIVNQLLLLSPDGSSRFAVREYLTVNREIRKLIREGDVDGIKEYQRVRRITMEQKLVDVSFEGRCTVDHARNNSEDEIEYDRFFAEEINNGKDSHSLIFEDDELEEYLFALAAHMKAGNTTAVQNMLETNDYNEAFKEYGNPGKSNNQNRGSGPNPSLPSV